MNSPHELSPEAVAAAQEAELLMERAKAYPVITTQEDLDSAGQELRNIVGRKRGLEDMRTELKKPILEAGRRIDAFFKNPMSFLEDAERAIKRQIGAYQERVEAQRREALRIAEEAARKERARLDAEAAERERKARLERERAEEKARAAEEAGKAEKAAALRLAAEESARQKEAQAEAMRVASATMPTNPVVHVPEAKAAGISGREKWSAKVTDKMAVIRAVASGEAPADLLEINMTLANKLAAALKSNLSFPGIRAVCERVISARA